LSRRILKGLSAVSLGLVAVVAPIGGAAAQADDVTAAYTYEWNDGVATGVPIPNPGGGCNDVTGAEGCFEPDGDKFYVKDTKADGYSAVVRWYTDYGRWGTCRNSLGAGKWAVCNKDFKEGYYIHWRVTRYNGDTGKWVDPESIESTGVA
jgi:hypothetical protein